MKTVDNLLHAKGNKKLGSHRKEVAENIESYIYHSTCIFRVDHSINRITVDNGGWDTSSTNRTINAYLNHNLTEDLLNRGYELLDTRK